MQGGFGIVLSGLSYAYSTAYLVTTQFMTVQNWYAISTRMTHSYIYIIGSVAPPYKVGISKDPKRRLKALQTGFPLPLSILHQVQLPATRTKLLETVIHRNLKHHRLAGEWFDVPLDQLILEVEFTIIRYLDDASLRIQLTQGLI
jgi:hypothetical protein